MSRYETNYKKIRKIHVKYRRQHTQELYRRIAIRQWSVAISGCAFLVVIRVLAWIFFCL